MRILIILFICCLDLLSARPAEEPTRFTFSNIENSENVIPSRLEKTQQLTSETQNNLDPTVFKYEKLNQSRRSIIPVQSTTPIVLFHPIPRETVRLENETEQAILEKPNPGVIRQVLNTVLTPKPIVDKIQEEEKYGNAGDRHIGVGKAVVNAYENFSNFLNTLVAIPLNIVRQTSRGITQTLDQVGGRLIGLQ
ncbi:uncharacterized protein [Linepithema humile]|uniref:uncharacterized protein n=1 Tax=Linepithema humile TaxID=83485 RepID=UPI000623A4FA|nr:PREDICTED: uncharacterized protein LOC105677808 [Linepithema humile]